MSHRHSSKRFVPVALAACALILASCGRNTEGAKRAYVDAADRYFKQGKYQEAIIEYRNALKIAPNLGDARLRLGEAYVRTGDQLNAYREYIRAADLMPENVDAQVRAGNALLTARQFEDAKARAQKALARDPRHAPA